MLKIFLVVLLLFWFYGCSKRESILSDSIKRERFINLRNGEKLIFHKSLDDEFVVMINYTPTDNREIFILSTDSQTAITTKSILLEGKRPITIKQIKYKSLNRSLRDMIPKWSNIYQVIFKKVKIDRIKLSITLKSEKQSAIFYKKAKYLDIFRHSKF